MALKHFHMAKVPSAEEDIIRRPLVERDKDQIVDVCTLDKVIAQYHSPASSAQHLIVSSYEAESKISSPMNIIHGFQTG